MREGDNFLLDEISLAEDAVLERLNSVVENSRTVVLAEKPGSSLSSRTVVAHPHFQLFATMNPGGDFGKRELSPALRSRFTEIWVPTLDVIDDFRLVLEKAFPLSSVCGVLGKRKLGYLKWFNRSVGADLSRAPSTLSLSLRDILKWSAFVKVCVEKPCPLDKWEAYLDGAKLMHLDGLGLGTGMSKEQSVSITEEAQQFLFDQVAQEQGHLPEISHEAFSRNSEHVGIRPFWIGKGTETVCGKPDFSFSAPTPWQNTRRILRALQLHKPILLEGPPTGQRLVRINLSEQTDISDLIGSDIPTHNEDSSTSVFHWAENDPGFCLMS